MMSDFQSEDSFVTTRKPHRCAYCGGEIPVGSRARVESGKRYGEMFRRYVCDGCDPWIETFWHWCPGGECADLEGTFEDFRQWLWEMYGEDADAKR